MTIHTAYHNPRSASVSYIRAGYPTQRAQIITLNNARFLVRGKKTVAKGEIVAIGDAIADGGIEIEFYLETETFTRVDTGDRVVGCDRLTLTGDGRWIAYGAIELASDVDCVERAIDRAEKITATETTITRVQTDVYPMGKALAKIRDIAVSNVRSHRNSNDFTVGDRVVVADLSSRYHGASGRIIGVLSSSASVALESPVVVITVNTNALNRFPVKVL